MKKLIILLLIVSSTGALAQNNAVIGKWKTIDDGTGEAKSIIEIYERNNKIYGKVIKLFRKPGEDPDPVCDECDEEDDRYKKKIIGMEVLRDMVKDEDEYTDGNILDPKDGKIYRCKIWLEGADLMVRGYWGPFYRTQTWKREP
jgi:uncharacterized protein (DUF2147 family)